MEKNIYRVDQSNDDSELDFYFDVRDLNGSVDRINSLFGLGQFHRFGVQFSGTESGFMVRVPGDGLFRHNVVVSAPINVSSNREEKTATLVKLFQLFVEAEYCYDDLTKDDNELTEIFREATRNSIVEILSEGRECLNSNDYLRAGLIKAPKDLELAGVVEKIYRTEEIRRLADLPEEKVISLSDERRSFSFWTIDEFGVGVEIETVFKNPDNYHLVIRHSGFNFDRLVLDPFDNVYKTYFDHHEPLDGIDTQAKLINLIVSLGRGYYDRQSLYRYRTGKLSDAEFKKAIFYHNQILLEYRNRSYFPIIETELFRYQFTKKLPD